PVGDSGQPHLKSQDVELRMGRGQRSSRLADPGTDLDDQGCLTPEPGVEVEVEVVDRLVRNHPGFVVRVPTDRLLRREARPAAGVAEHLTRGAAVLEERVVGTGRAHGVRHGGQAYAPTEEEVEER